MRPKGFTLLELLVTLTLFAGIMALVTGSYMQFHRIEARLSEERELDQEMRTLVHLITDDLSRAFYSQNFAKAGENQEKWQSGIFGDTQTEGEFFLSKIDMHVKGPARFLRGLPREFDPEIHEVGYEMVQERESSALIRREEYYLDDEMTGGTRSQVQVLTEKILSFRVQYYDEEQKRFFNRWTSKPDKPLPQAVRVTLILKGEAERNLERSFSVNLLPSLGTGVVWVSK